MQRACVAQITRRSDDAASVAGTEPCDRWKRSRRYMRGKRNQKTNATKNENGPESVLNISYDWQLRGDKYQATQPSSGGAKAQAGQVIKLRILHAAPVFNAFLVRRHLGCCGRIQPPARPRASRLSRRVLSFDLKSGPESGPLCGRILAPLPRFAGVSLMMLSP